MFSIIVPFYKTNPNKFKECLSSIEHAILFSNYSSDIELIFIDDGNEDIFYRQGIKLLFKEYNYKIIKHHKNLGIVESRKRGLKHARNEWICFIDSDDKIALDYFELLEQYIEDDIDFILHERFIQNENSILSFEDNIKNKTFDRQYLQDNLTSHIFTPTWSKCWRRSFLKQIEFDSVWAAEDILHWLRAVNKVKKFKILPERIYCYNPTKDSISTKSALENNTDKIIEEAKQFIEDNNLGNFNEYIKSIEKINEEIKNDYRDKCKTNKRNRKRNH